MFSIFLVLFVAEAQAAERPAYSGLDSLAIMSPKFPCDAWLRVEDRVAQPAGTVLWGTFGDDATCLAKFTERYRTRSHLLLFRLLNGTCYRNRNCNPIGEIFWWNTVADLNWNLENGNIWLFQALADRLSNMRAVIDETSNENTVVLLDLSLENDLSDRALANLNNFVQARWPYGLIVTSGKRAGGLLLERHGRGAVCKGAVIISNEDGDIQSQSRSRKFLMNNSRCYVTLLWRSELQGRGKDGKYPRGVWPGDRNFVLTPKTEREVGDLLELYGSR